MLFFCAAAFLLLLRFFLFFCFKSPSLQLIGYGSIFRRQLIIFPRMRAYKIASFAFHRHSGETCFAYFIKIILFSIDNAFSAQVRQIFCLSNMWFGPKVFNFSRFKNNFLHFSCRVCCWRFNLIKNEDFFSNYINCA